MPLVSATVMLSASPAYISYEGVCTCEIGKVDVRAQGSLHDYLTVALVYSVVAKWLRTWITVRRGSLLTIGAHHSSPVVQFMDVFFDRFEFV